jgi:hypothetical protein
MNLCKVYGCNYKDTHITEDHSCGNCGHKGHGKVECGNQLAINFLKEYKEYDKFDKIKNFSNDIKTVEKQLKTGQYTSIYSGLGSSIFIRKSYKNRCQYLFMNQDDWGQYGLETSRKPIYDKFISGYIEIIHE